MLGIRPDARSRKAYWTCQGQGACAVPLVDKIWVKARKKFEAALTKAEKEFGAAPKKGRKK